MYVDVSIKQKTSQLCDHKRCALPQVENGWPYEENNIFPPIKIRKWFCCHQCKLSHETGFHKERIPKSLNIQTFWMRGERAKRCH